MLLSEKINKSIRVFEEIADMLYKGDGAGLVRIKTELDDISKLLNIFIRIIPSLKDMGIDIPEEIIEAQINNMQEGLEHRDYILIADTLKYEINDTLAVIDDLMVKGVIKDEELF